MANRLMRLPYTYTKLTEHTTFRVLRLHRRLPFAELKASLETFPLGDAPKYEAISYRWDARGDSSSLSVDGFLLPVSLRVRDILDELSSASRAKYIWIDSVCINQADLDERSKQVALMGEIYRGATRVLVCLEGAKNGKFLINTVLPPMRKSIQSDAAGKDVKKQKLSDETVVALMDLLNDPFWTRTWIIQEIALAKSIKIIYGQASLTWEEYTDIFRAFLSRPPHIMPAINRLFISNIRIFPPKGLVPVQNIFDLRRAYQGKSNYRVTFGTAVWAILGSQATDPRDKIFGTLGLMVDGNTELLKPNYTKSVQEVYYDATRYLLAGEYPYRFLHFSGLQPGKSTALQSWVPDWNLASSMSVLAQPGHPVPYRTGGTSAGIPRIETTAVIEVHLQGIRTGRVARMADLLIPYFYHDTEESEDLNPVKTYLRWVNEAFRLVINASNDTDSEYSHGQTRFDAFWRTICGDRLRFPAAIRPIPSIFVNAWAKWYHDLKRVALDEGLETEIDDTLDSIMRVFEVSDDMAEMRDAFEGAMGQTAYGRKMAIMDDRRMALIPQTAQVGDEIWVILGSETPVCLRRVADDAASDGASLKNRFQLVGESYLHGIMDGEALKSGTPVEEIALV